MTLFMNVFMMAKLIRMDNNLKFKMITNVYVHQNSMVNNAL